MKKSILNAEPNKTILVITIGFLIIYYIKQWQWAINTSIIVGILGLFSEYFSKKINFIWKKTTWIINIIIQSIVLSAIYYLILTPIAFLSKICSEKNQLTLKNTEQSLFKERNKNFNKDLFEKLW